MARMSAGVRKPATPHERIDRLANQLDRLEKALMGAAMVSDLAALRHEMDERKKDCAVALRVLTNLDTANTGLRSDLNSTDKTIELLQSTTARIDDKLLSLEKQVKYLFARTGKKGQAEQLALPFEGMTIEVGFKPRRKD